MNFLKTRCWDSNKITYFNMEHVLAISEDDYTENKCTIRYGNKNDQFTTKKDSIKIIEVKPNERIGFLSQEEMEI